MIEWDGCIQPIPRVLRETCCGPVDVELISYRFADDGIVNIHNGDRNLHLVNSDGIQTRIPIVQFRDGGEAKLVVRAVFVLRDEIVLIAICAEDVIA